MELLINNYDFAFTKSNIGDDINVSLRKGFYCNLTYFLQQLMVLNIRSQYSYGELR